MLKVWGIIIFLSLPSNTLGQSAIVNKVWLEHGTQQNGNRGMTIHADINVSRMKGKKIQTVAYFYDSRKNKLKGGVKGYRTGDGQVSVSDYGTPSYEDAHFPDFDIFIPYNSLPLKSGKQTYYVLVDVLDAKNNIFLSNNWNYVSFEGTGSMNNSQDVINNNGKTVKVFYESGTDKISYLTFDGKICYWSDANGNRRFNDYDYVYEGEQLNCKVYSHYWDKPLTFSNYTVKTMSSQIRVTSDYSKLTCYNYSTSTASTYQDYYNIPYKGEVFPFPGKIMSAPSPGDGGNMVNPGSSINGNVDYSTKCSGCNGTGNCWHCGGKGRYWNNGTNSWEACTICLWGNGSGKCKYCRGTGYYRKR